MRYRKHVAVQQVLLAAIVLLAVNKDIPTFTEACVLWITSHVQEHVKSMILNALKDSYKNALDCKSRFKVQNKLKCDGENAFHKSIRDHESHLIGGHAPVLWLCRALRRGWLGVTVYEEPVGAYCIVRPRLLPSEAR